MDVINATVEGVGEITFDKFSGKEVVWIDVSTPSTPKKRYIIYRNEKHAFDLIKNFEANLYRVGDTIEFNYNSAIKGSFNTIWKIYNHKRTS